MQWKKASTAAAVLTTLALLGLATPAQAIGEGTVSVYCSQTYASASATGTGRSAGATVAVPTSAGASDDGTTASAWASGYGGGAAAASNDHKSATCDVSLLVDPPECAAQMGNLALGASLADETYLPTTYSGNLAFSRSTGSYWFTGTRSTSLGTSSYNAPAEDGPEGSSALVFRPDSDNADAPSDLSELDCSPVNAQFTYDLPNLKSVASITVGELDGGLVGPIN